MKVWVVAGEYPTPKHPGHGIFVADQVAALEAEGHSVRVVHSPAPSLRPVANIAKPALRSAAEAIPRRNHDSGSGSGGLPPVALTVPLPEEEFTGDIIPGVVLDDLPQPTKEQGRRSGVTRARATAAWTGRAARGTGRVVHDAAGTTVAVTRMVSQMRQLALRDGRPDVIHAHNVFPAGIAASKLTASRNVPYVITEHMTAYLRGQYSPVELAAAIKVMDRAKTVIAVSTLQAEALPIPTDRVTVVPNVVDVHAFRLRPESAAARGTVLCIGKLTRHKRMDLMLRAYAGLPAELRRQHPLRILGSGPERSSLTSLAASLGLRPEVMCGQRSRSEVVAEMSRAAVLVSTSEVETFGVTMIEALAAGVPFLATDSGGPRDFAEPGLGRLVAPPRAIELDGALTRALAEVLQAPADPAADRARRETAVARFGPRAVASTLGQIYADACRR